MNSNPFQQPSSVEPIWTTPKNIHEEIHVDLTEWSGKMYIDVRVYHEDGRPSARGITAHPEVWRALVQLVTQALAELDRRAG